MRFDSLSVPNPLGRLRRATAARALALGLLAMGALSGSVGAAGDDGVIDDESYESPNFGYEVEWGRPWDLDTEGTFSDEGFDALTLCSSDVCLAILGLEEELTPEESIEGYIESDASLLDDLEVYEQDADDSFAYATFSGESENGNRLIVHIEVRELEEATPDDPADHLIAILIAPEDDYDSFIASAADDIEIDGDPAFLATGAEEEEREDRDADEDEDADERDRDEDEDDSRDEDEDDEDDRSNDDEDDEDRSEDDEDQDDDNDQ